MKPHTIVTRSKGEMETAAVLRAVALVGEWPAVSDYRWTAESFMATALRLQPDVIHGDAIRLCARISFRLAAIVLDAGGRP